MDTDGVAGFLAFTLVSDSLAYHTGSRTSGTPGEGVLGVCACRNVRKCPDLLLIRSLSHVRGGAAAFKRGFVSGASLPFMIVPSSVFALSDETEEGRCSAL